MSTEDAVYRFFQGEAVKLSDLKECVGPDNDELMLLVMNVAYMSGLVYKIYEVGGEKRMLSALGFGFYALVKGLYEDGSGE